MRIPAYRASFVTSTKLVLSILLLYFPNHFSIRRNNWDLLINNPVVIFDSGVGSLSIVRELKKEIPHENLLYFADKAHFPYGAKSRYDLRQLIINTVKYLERYEPKLTIIASNTPSIQVLDEIKASLNVPLIGVKPPLEKASKLTKKKHIGIMATYSTIMSKEFEHQIRKKVPQDILITKYNASPIIELIEDGIDSVNERKTFDVIVQVLGESLDTNIDVMILASTHLPFVKNYLISLLPSVKFLDPSRSVARQVKKFLAFNRMLRKKGAGRLEILVTDKRKQFEQTIRNLGINQPVKEVFLTF
jgi:glutamate racemase